MGDMWADGVPAHWQQEVLRMIRACPTHTFICLTKAGHNLPHFEWPPNCWVGVSITGALPEVDRRNLAALKQARARVKWVSVEPLLAPWAPDLSGIQWVVVGSLSGPHARQPQVEWVGDIMEEAGKRNITLWLKRNLSPPWAAEDLIQELPGERRVYLAKVQFAHPDKGGDEARFKRLQKAYEYIAKVKGQDHKG